MFELLEVGVSPPPDSCRRVSCPHSGFVGVVRSMRTAVNTDLERAQHLVDGEGVKFLHGHGEFGHCE